MVDKSEMIVRHVNIDRTLTPQQILAATGRERYIDPKEAENMPRGVGDEVDVSFFNVGPIENDDDLDREFNRRGLTPDPYSQAQVHIDDPSFSDSHPNATHWKNPEGQWCRALYFNWDGERSVEVGNYDTDYPGHWWHAGITKPSAP